MHLSISGGWKNRNPDEWNNYSKSALFNPVNFQYFEFLAEVVGFWQTYWVSTDCIPGERERESETTKINVDHKGLHFAKSPTAAGIEVIWERQNTRRCGWVTADVGVSGKSRKPERGARDTGVVGFYSADSRLARYWETDRKIDAYTPLGSATPAFRGSR